MTVNTNFSDAMPIPTRIGRVEVSGVRFLWLLLTVSTGALFVVFRTSFRADSPDSIVIRELALGTAYFLPDESYRVVSSAYRIAGLANLPIVASLAGYFCTVICVFAVAKKCQAIPVKTPVFVLHLVTLILSAIFLGTYSKDVFVLPIVVVLLYATSKWRGELLVWAAMMAYAMFFRQYWFFVLGAYVALRFATRAKISLRRLFLCSCILVIAVGIVISLAQGVPADFFRTKVNLYRVGDAVTLISRFIELPEPFGGAVNNLLTLFSLIFPLPLLLLTGPYYVFLSIMILSIWVIFLRGVTGISTMTERPILIIRSVCLIFAFTATQAVFEPDYGSALRHLTPLLSLFLLVVWFGHRISNDLIESRPSA